MIVITNEKDPDYRLPPEGGSVVAFTIEPLLGASLPSVVAVGSFSVVRLRRLTRRSLPGTAADEITYTCVLPERPADSVEVVDRAVRELCCKGTDRDVLVGWHLDWDLAALGTSSLHESKPVTPTSVATWEPSGIPKTRERWSRRGEEDPPGVIDVGLDVPGQPATFHALCEANGLQVIEPELDGKSITALHHAWFAGDAGALGRLSALTLRRSLVVALVASRRLGAGRHELNVDRLAVDLLAAANPDTSILATPTAVAAPFPESTGDRTP